MEEDGTRWNTMEQDGTDGCVVTYRSNQASWVVVDFQVVVQIPVLHVREQSGNSSIRLDLPYSTHRTKKDGAQIGAHQLGPTLEKHDAQPTNKLGCFMYIDTCAHTAPLSMAPPAMAPPLSTARS
jgi:hypothetical protein